MKKLSDTPTFSNFLRNSTGTEREAVFLDVARKASETQAACQHQELMGMLKEEGWLTGRYTAMWGKLLKNSRINSIDLKRLIDAAKASKYDTRGVVRNALRDRSWTKYF